LDLLVCPHCGGDLRQNGASLICSNGHTANIARQGYVSLLGRRGGTHTADTAEMIAARERVLGAGLFEPVAEAVASAATVPQLATVEGAVADLGSGPGYYLERVLEAAPSRFGIGIDNSKYAARRAARRHPRGGAVVADIWDEVPLKDDSVAVAVNVFAPRNGAEIRRILVPGGKLVVVTPEPSHLEQLIEPFSMISVDSDKEERLAATLSEVGEQLQTDRVDWQMKLSRSEVGDLVSMGPSSGRLDPEEMEAALDSLEYPAKVTGSVRVTLVEAPDPAVNRSDAGYPE
jgi:23S rRNA (guanine745-N1)-methyltransferase